MSNKALFGLAVVVFLLTAVAVFALPTLFYDNEVQMQAQSETTGKGKHASVTGNSTTRTVSVNEINSIADLKRVAITRRKISTKSYKSKYRRTGLQNKNYSSRNNTVSLAQIKQQQAYARQQMNDAGGKITALSWIFFLGVGAVLLFTMFCLCSVFTKAGESPVSVFIPIYNFFVLLRIADKPWYFIFLLFIPVVSLIVSIMIWIGVAERFQRGPLFGIGLCFLPFIFIPILAFSSNS